MALSGTMLIPDIAGESRRADHEDEIDIMSIDWNMSQASNMQQGSGRTSSRATVNPLGITKTYDASSPYLALACMQGKAFDEITISFRQDSGEAHLDYLKITLTNVIISSYSLNGSAMGEEISDSISLSFEKVKKIYTVQADDHSRGDEHEIEYDVSAGV
ncbi:type VI secretion system tube protein Hcp [Rhodobacteraceae bacterium]|nr:type VI secretion system tube protein Hcp [Paracoccaceae bacterium]